MTSEAPLDTPLVSIGVPIRNGAHFTAGALETLIRQTYTNIEIIVSDNASEDETSAVVASFASTDIRIRSYRHDRTLTAAENFYFVFKQARGAYFMWAACDDRRSLDYVEQLLMSLVKRPDATLAFGNVAEITEIANWPSALPFLYTFETYAQDTMRDRLTRYTTINCLHVYGLIRSSALQAYEWIDIDNGADISLLVHLSIAGHFVRSEGGCFYYYVPVSSKTPEERALVNNLRKLRPFPELRLSWACARTAHRTGGLYRTPILTLTAFAIIYTSRHLRWIKPWLFEHSPDFLVNFYRRFLKRRS